MPLQTVFATALGDHGTVPKELLGVLRIEQDATYGPRCFQYGFNSSALTISEGDSAMFDGALGADVTLSSGSTTTALRSSGSFVTLGVKPGDIIVCVDDAGGAGAAPEQEYSIVTGVTALQVDFSPALTVALAASDKVNFVRRYATKASAAACGAPEYAGVAMADIATLEYGWYQCQGIHPAGKVVASTAYSEGDLLKPGASVLAALADAANNGECVAVVLVAIQSDAARNRTVVKLLGKNL